MKKSLLLFAAFPWIAIGGCADEGCPDAHVRLDGKCVLYTEAFAQHRGGASSTPKNEAGKGGSDAEPVEAPFDAPCQGHTTCGGETNYCATPIGLPTYCTLSGCETDPSVCPEGWSCFDLGSVVPGEPHICLKPNPVGNGAFGDICNTHEDCKNETNYCTASPTEPPYCSVSGCDADPDLCPEGWLCFDVGQFVPGEPFVCVKPPPAM